MFEDAITFSFVQEEKQILLNYFLAICTSKSICKKFECWITSDECGE